jgi:hypothetical protein
MCSEALSFGIGPERSLVHYFLPARGETFSCKLPSPQGERPSSSPCQQRGKVSPDARQCLAEGRACREFFHGYRSWTPSRKWLRAKGCRHGRAFEDASRGVLTTSSRSSVAGATLAFTMPLVPPALCCFPLVLSHLLWERSATAMVLCSPERGCLRLVPASGFWTALHRCVIRPFCITILYHNLLLFIDIFHI